MADDSGVEVEKSTGGKVREDEIETTEDAEDETKLEETSTNKEGKSSESSVAATEYDAKNVSYEGEIAIYTDPKTNYKYKWDGEKSEWVPHNQYGFEDDTHTYTDADGIKYFWDKEKEAWFPKINDDFLAQYQMNYGFTDDYKNIKDQSEDPKPVAAKKEVKEAESNAAAGIKRKPSEPAWFEMDESRNTKVYVSNLPQDITEDEFAELMSKYGIIMRDINTNKLKIKLYMDRENKELKGDAICTFIRRESVDLALKLLDGLEFRGRKLHAELAKFQMKGSYDPKLKPKTKKRKEKEKIKKQQEKLFDWRPERKRGEPAKHERCVILKNLFDPKMFDEDVGLILELQEDLREECCKSGEVRKVIIYDRHPEGVAQINMQDAECATACVQLLNNRWFSKRQITAEIWDGKTKFKIAETDSEINQRLDNWDKFLEGEEKKEPDNKATNN